MNNILKQRLVGALILVALGVVFWPIIFVQPGQRSDAEQPRIPPRPVVDTSPIEPPDQVGLRSAREVEARSALAKEQEQERERVGAPQSGEDVLLGSTPAAPAADTEQEPVASNSTPEETPAPEPRTRDEAPEKLALDSQGVPIAWILQVASVSSAEKAEQLREQLLQKDRKAYSRKITRNGKELYRVYIGPKFERARLEDMQAEVDREFGVNSLIVRYVP